MTSKILYSITRARNLRLRVLLTVICVYFSPSFASSPWEPVDRCAELLTSYLRNSLAENTSHFRTPSGSYYDPKAMSAIRNTLAWSFFEIAASTAFISQTDSRYMRLVPENIGLCSPTSMITTILALRRFYSHGLFYHPTLETYQVELLSKIRCDMRNGLALSALERLLKEKMMEIGLAHAVQVNLIEGPLQSLLALDHHANQNLIWIASVQMNAGVSHAIVILDIDLKNKTALISDPNYPNYILNVPIEIARWGQGETIRFPRGLRQAGQDQNTYVRSFLLIRAARNYGR